MADALASGASVRKDVGVQLPPCPPPRATRTFAHLPLWAYATTADHNIGGIMLNVSQVFTSLPASDVERAKKFYEEKLGLIPKEESVGRVIYEVGGSSFFLYPSQYAGTNKATSACLAVDSCRQTVDDLTSRGIEFEEYDIPGARRDGVVHTVEGVSSAWFKDSEGNIISVTQYS